ncbi:methyl-accepting chemotaxis protein [Chitiniphilus shinanonensis]|uniref:methyl-accepting chemotaxis protein n=1 Tax=Chitiniphilus shinanonensis TaxID=553088 RepID=UPI003068BD50
MKIGMRMRLLGLLSVIVLILTTLVAWCYIQKARAPVQDLTSNVIPTLAILNQLNADFSDSRRTLLVHLLEQDDTRMAEIQAQFEREQARLVRLMDDYDRLLFDEQDRRYAAVARREMAAYHLLARQAFQASSEHRRQDALDMVSRITAPQARKVLDQLETMSNYYGQLTTQADRSIHHSFAALLSVLSGLCVATALAMLASSELVTRSVTGPLHRLRDFVVHVAHHYEFSHRLPAAGRDEVAETSRAFNSLLDILQDNLWQPPRHDTAAAAPLEGPSSPVPLPAPGEAVAERVAAEAGRMDSEMAGATQELVAQTNAVSRSAAIAAAHAGEASRGFAGSAERLRRLAGRTLATAGEIAGSAEQIRREVGHTADALYRAADASIDEDMRRRIRHQGQTVADQVNRLATAIHEHDTASGEMAQEIEKAAQLSEQIGTNALRACEASNELHRLAQRMRKLQDGAAPA